MKFVPEELHENERKLVILLCLYQFAKCYLMKLVCCILSKFVYWKFEQSLTAEKKKVYKFEVPYRLSCKQTAADTNPTLGARGHVTHDISKVGIYSISQIPLSNFTVLKQL